MSHPFIWDEMKTRDPGIVAVDLDLKVAHTCTFIGDGIRTPPIPHPPGCTVIPAACLLKIGQQVTLRSFVAGALPAGPIAP